MGLNTDYDELIERGLELLEAAEAAEHSEDWARSIFKYQQAAEVLSQCKLPREKLDEIYDRIAYLNRVKEHEKEQKAAQPQVDVDGMQEKAFQMIDNAKALEKENRLPDAVDSLMHAVQYLSAAGWEPA
ncbi:MAG: hypothetical protein GF364_20580, partial [Candidatus Lokiarchaeota archaeon]|nr:hypothetical protein [Candidatus Lokiarchaeota archaeon]